MRLDHLLSKEKEDLKDLLFIFQCTLNSTLKVYHILIQVLSDGFRNIDLSKRGKHILLFMGL